MTQQHVQNTRSEASSQASLVLPSVGLPGLSLPAPVSSASLLRGNKSLTIEHDGVIYRLQVTRLGKLILTK